MPENTLTKHIFRRTLIISTTLATIGGAVLAVTLGADHISARASAVEIVETAELIPVQVISLRIEEGFSIPRQFVGQVEAAQSTDLSFEFAGNVAEILVDEGDHVSKGDLLARLDTAILEAERTRLMASRTALEARLEFAQVSLQRRQELSERGFTSIEAFDQAISNEAELTARIAETTAAIKNIDIQIEKASMTSPFDGSVGARLVDTGGNVSPGAPVITLLEQAEPIVRIGLPVDFSIDQHADFRVKLNDIIYPARVQTIRPDVDPVTRTRTALFRVDLPADAAFGQSATLLVDRQVDVAGAWVPLLALREGAQGLWTVLVLDDENVVRHAAVELLHSDGENAFVRGSFADGANLIQSGPHRVAPGQQVRVIAGR
ncbi:efflux RND transporter periplasmic adaptor subunit [Pseudaestuariivita rosea]|uniref:efflux RND transporter periplasmic adaptor subunit n=1 Tax=Pseudaestuariivita rosea TaxID=2763263 RepID=UPI001ABA9F8C|nr:efflux RND transporter periplasmic adaptor subunit [Pseudaestuariivita rosea]